MKIFGSFELVADPNLELLKLHVHMVSIIVLDDCFVNKKVVQVKLSQLKVLSTLINLNDILLTLSV